MHSVQPGRSGRASAMPYVNLGRSGLLVSRLSFGAWITFGTTVDEDKAYDLLKLCLTPGSTFSTTLKRGEWRGGGSHGTALKR